jgi:molybdopterin/thiamine biosynthesis adenylyltransferase
MSDALYVNPWRFRAWEAREVILGGVAARRVPQAPLLDSLQTNNAVVERSRVEPPGLAWLERDRFLLPEPMPLDHAYAPQLGFFSFWPGPPEERLERLARASVGVLGVGGLGSQVAHLLAAAGVGRLVLCDRDVVEVRNLNRQLYDTTDLGRVKVEAAAERLRKLRPGIEVEPLRRTLDTASDIEDAVRGVDFVVRAVDTPVLAALEVNLASRRMGIPHVGGGFLETWGVAGPFISADGPCFRCLVPPPDMELPADDRKVPSFAPLTFWLSAQVAGDVLRHLAGLGRPWLLERTMMLDWASGETREQTYRPLPGRCPACGRENPSVNGSQSDGAAVPRVPGEQGGSASPGGGSGRGGAGAGGGSGVAPGGVAGAAGAGVRGAAVPDGAPAPGALTGVPAGLVALCAVLAGVALLQAPLALRLATVLTGVLLASAAGALAARPRSLLNGYLWGASWVLGVVTVGAVQLVLTTSAIMARPLSGVATILVGVPIDVLLLSLPGLLAAWAATRAKPVS